MTTLGPWGFATATTDGSDEFLYSNSQGGPSQVNDTLPATSGNLQLWWFTGSTGSSNVGPTSGQDNDGYIYPECSDTGTGFNDTYTMELDTTLDASAEQWQFNFYTNQRGDDNDMTCQLQINESGGGWVDVGAEFGGSGDPDKVASSGTQIWSSRSVDLSNSGANTDASTRVRILLTMPASGTTWHNDYGIDTVEVVGTPLSNVTITNMEDEDFRDGETAITITGTGFEASQAGGKVEISDNIVYATGTKVAQTVESWSDTSIDIEIVLGALAPGNTGLFVWVTNDSAEINSSYEIGVHRKIAIELVGTDSTLFSGEDAITGAEVTGGTGSFTNGLGAENANPFAGAIDIGENNHSEVAWAWRFTADAIDTGVYEFRVVEDDGTLLDTYTDFPEATFSGGDNIALTALTGAGAGVGQTPVLTNGHNFTASEGLGAGVGQVPISNITTVIDFTDTAQAGAGAGVGQTPSILTDVLVTALAGIGAGVGQVPAIITDAILTAQAGAGSGVGQTPISNIGTNISLTAQSGAGAGVGQAASIDAGVVLTADAGAGTGVGQIPTANIGDSVDVFLVALAGAGAGVGQVASISADVLVTADSGLGSGVGQVPISSINSNVSATALAGAGTGVGQTPTADIGTNVSLVAQAGAGSGVGQTPVITHGHKFTANAGIGSGVGQVPTLNITSVVDFTATAQAGAGAGVGQAPVLNIGDGITAVALAGTGLGVGQVGVLTNGHIFTAGAGTGLGVGQIPTIQLRVLSWEDVCNNDPNWSGQNVESGDWSKVDKSIDEWSDESVSPIRSVKCN
jgi:hypothetical protein